MLRVSMASILALTLLLVTTLPSMGSESPAITSGIITAAPAPLSGEQQALFDSLVEAKRTGDPDRILAIERELAQLDGRQLGMFSRDVTDEYTMVTGDDLRMGAAGERWANNDVLVFAGDDDSVTPDIAHDELGSLFCVHVTGSPERLVISRSDDGGATWQLWLEVVGGSPEYPSIAIARGTENRLLVAFKEGSSEIRLLRVNLDDVLDSEVILVENEVELVAHPIIVTDGNEYDGWYAYLIWNNAYVDDFDTDWKLFFAYSQDMAATWSTLGPIHTYCTEYFSMDQYRPNMDFGNDIIHVVFEDLHECTGTNRDIFTMKSSNFGISWSTPTLLATNRTAPAIAVQSTGGGLQDVMVAYTTISMFATDVRYTYSTDLGSTWSTELCLSCDEMISQSNVDLATNPGGPAIYAAFKNAGAIQFLYTEILSSEVWIEQDGGNNDASSFGDPRIASIPGDLRTHDAGIVWSDDRDGPLNIYCDGTATPNTGTIVVDCEPEGFDGWWSLIDPDGYPTTGMGDAILSDMQDGDYTLSWFTADDWLTPPPTDFTLWAGTTETIVGTYHYLPPLITTITDVPGDQGRNLRLSWEPALFDPGEVTGYMVYRRQDGRDGHVRGDRLDGWDGLVWMSAHGDDSYHYVAPTLCDSTAAGGVCWSTFFVRATTADPLTFYDSSQDSAYSVDNLFPGVPGNLAMPASNLLTWDPCSDADFDYFSVYQSENGEFGSYELLGHTAGTHFDVSDAEGSYLAVTARDESGNESALSAILFNGTAVGETPSTPFALRQNTPNPFNPSTRIGFDLPQSATVSLTIFDLVGRRIRTLAQGESYAAGSHALTWNGCDEAGDLLSTGVYFYRIEAGAYSATRKMILMK